MSMRKSSGSFSSFSSRSISTNSIGPLSVSGGTFRGRAPSVYAGAGGFGTRISNSGSSVTSYTDIPVISNEKVTMQNLNDRLAAYLEKVRSLEEANQKLELQIKDYCDKKTFISRDLTAYYATIADLQTRVARKHSENQSILLQMDNAQLASEDFRVKYEMELNLRTVVEADVARLRGIRDSLTLATSDLELQIEALRDELAYIKRNHEEDMHLLRSRDSGSLNVTMDSADSVDLNSLLQEIRTDYEALILKNNQEVEKWYQQKMEILNKEITTYTTEVNTFRTELSELKRTYQATVIERDGILQEIQGRQQYLQEVNARYGAQLSQLQATITMLETELQQLLRATEQQQSEYRLLLDIKMRLEMEIAEYRRLLGGEHEKKTVVISKVTEELEEHKPHVERRVKTIEEVIVDGKVVSSSIDTQVEEVTQ